MRTMSTEMEMEENVLVLLEVGEGCTQYLLDSERCRNHSNLSTRYITYPPGT